MVEPEGQRVDTDKQKTWSSSFEWSGLGIDPRGIALVNRAVVVIALDGDRANRLMAWSNCLVHLTR